jgi:hypothetical protein
VPEGRPRYGVAAAVVGISSAAVLVLTADYQIYDNNLYTLSEALSLLSGEHPYRDFFEWGVLLQAGLSALMQRVLGYRLLSEFLLQWTFIVAGMVMAFHIAVRLSRSVPVSLATIGVAVLDLAATPTYQYTKLFVYPAAIIVIWRYMDRPDVRGAVWLAVVTATAFFFRHDHGIYVGLAVLLGMGLARLLHGRALSGRTMATNLAACAVAGAVFVVPWAIVVERSEGLVDYVEARAVINRAWKVQRSVFLTVADMNPVRVLTPGEHRDLDGDESLHASALRTLPERGDALDWLHQATVLTTLLALAAALVPLLRGRRHGERAFREGAHLLVAAALVALVERQLFREPSYYVLVAPLVAALGARLLAGPRDDRHPLAPPAVGIALRGAGTLVLLVTLVAVAGYSRESNILEPGYQYSHLPQTFMRLTASPPIDGLVPEDAAHALTRHQWSELGTGDRSDLLVRYVHECSLPGDHLFVSGQTPYHIAYYAGRPVAGGHVYWHDTWRSDPMREAQSLELLKRQSVPFAYATHNTVLDDLARYPRIRAYFATHYTPLHESNGRVLYDTRRAPTGTFAKLGFPCFAEAKGQTAAATEGGYSERSAATGSTRAAR